MTQGNFSLEIPDGIISSVFGRLDEFARKVEATFGVSLINREGRVNIVPNTAMADVARAMETLSLLSAIAARGEDLTETTVNYTIATILESSVQAKQLIGQGSDTICSTISGRPIKPKTWGQKQYVESIRKNTIVFATGPAGTGKTYLAMAMAITAFRLHQVTRIVLTRPAIEAGEKLGFLPGDLQQKVDPYLRPLYDALNDIMGAENFQKNLERSQVEVAPLAYMRGRTLDNSFIVLDEAQNTTPEQMKMFLTRLGQGSKAVITGDITQIDLPEGKISGLKDAVRVLRGIDDIGISQLTNKDVVRHPLVQKIIAAYEKHTPSSRKPLRRR